MRFRTWPVAAIGLGSLLLLIVVSMLTALQKAQEIYAELDQLNTHHHNVDAKLRRLRSDVNLSGIFVRDYLLDVARSHAPEYRERLAEFRRTNVSTVAELRGIDASLSERIASLDTLLEEYWGTFEPLFDWTSAEKISSSAAFLRQEVVPRREAILKIAQEIEELNNANLASQRVEVTHRQSMFRADLMKLLRHTLVLGTIVALVAVFRLRTLEGRSDQQRAFAEEAERQMRQLSQRLVAAQEEERKSLSRELHDHVAQVLTALRMELGRIERALPSSEPRPTAAMTECRRLVDQLFHTVRDLALGLRPSMLDDFGLQPALEWHLRDVSRRFDLDVELKVTGDLEAVPDRHRTCVYRAVQEALTNCVRHSEARAVRVTVEGDERGLDVSVQDNGIGLDDVRQRNGLGLRGIEERVRELGGILKIAPAEGGGTRLSIHLPIEESPLARAAG
jgi:signal transduction histidine kinase